MRSFSLAEYEQRVPIRIGSLSQCFAAQHPERGEVLLKQLLPAFARVPAVAVAWLDRAEENSRFDHPGCSPVLDWGEALGEAYLTLPALPVLSLRDLLQSAAKTGLWPSSEVVVSVAKGALEALVYVHKSFGLVHLDLDPHALLLRRDGSLVLSEFGMWRALSPEAATRERFDRGRVAYLCPELTKSLEGDARSDVFSLGAILYELIGKQRPFQGATQLVTAMAIAEGRRRPLRELAPDAPEVLCDIVETMLAHKPDERFQSAQAGLGALSSCCQGEPRAVASWLESLALRAGPQGGFGREKRAAAPSPAASAARAPTAALHGPEGHAGATPALLAPAGEHNSLSPLPPPLLSPPVLASVSAAAGRPVQDDWLAPPPLLAPGRPSAPPDAAPEAPQVRDGRTAFLDTGAARKAAASAPSAHVASEAPRAPSLRMADMVTRDTPAVSDTSPPRSPTFSSSPPVRPGAAPVLPAAAPVSSASFPGAPPASSLAPPRPFASALPPPAMPPQPLRSSLPPLESDPRPSGDKRGWQEPSKTVFQVKAFARQATRRSDKRAPLLVIVVLSVAFGFALVAAAALLWRLLAS